MGPCLKEQNRPTSAVPYAMGPCSEDPTIVVYSWTPESLAFLNFDTKSEKRRARRPVLVDHAWPALPELARQSGYCTK